MRNITYGEALREALISEMTNDESVFLIGEDIGVLGNVFGVTKDLLEKFGKKRVRNSPISEAAIAGAAVGSSMLGQRPVAEIMYIDFITIAMDQIINQAAKLRYMSGGKIKLPLVIRTQGGSGTGEAAQHSQSLEAFFMHIPGLIVVMPSTPYDAKGLLVSAIRDDNPVIFIEHKKLYPLKGFVPEEAYAIQLGKADIKCEGNDLTIVATSYMLYKIIYNVVPKLNEMGVKPEVIDPRTISPLDKYTIYNSVKKTNKLLIVQEAVAPCSFASDLSASVSEELQDYLDAPVKRLCGAFCPIPYNKSLEESVIPQENEIIVAVKELINYR